MMLFISALIFVIGLGIGLFLGHRKEPCVNDLKETPLVAVETKPVPFTFTYNPVTRKVERRY